MILLLACSTTSSSDELAEMLAARSSLEECAAVEVEELRTLCYVEVAATKAGLGQDEQARAACAAIPEGVWREECHFRAGEELGRKGETDLALRHCAQAGDFSRNCLTHTFWGLPLGQDLRSDQPARVLAAMDEFLVTVDVALEGSDLQVEARDGLLARAWFNVYVGSGIADPAAARAAVEGQAPYARTAWALEAVRLLEDPSLEGALGAWDQVLLGEPTDRRLGRHARPVIPDALRDAPMVGIFGGGARLTDPDPEVDVPRGVIQRIEALFQQVEQGLAPKVLHQELTRWGLFDRYQDRFLNLFRHR